MVYVNKLGNIVHSATHAYYGMANKNVGDAFLLSWKICDGELEGFARFEDLASEEQRLNANDSVRCPALHPSTRGKRYITPSEMADSAVNAFLKCIIDLEQNCLIFGGSGGVKVAFLPHERVQRYRARVPAELGCRAM